MKLFFSRFLVAMFFVFVGIKIAEFKFERAHMPLVGYSVREANFIVIRISKDGIESGWEVKL